GRGGARAARRQAAARDARTLRAYRPVTRRPRGDGDREGRVRGLLPQPAATAPAGRATPRPAAGLRGVRPPPDLAAERGVIGGEGRERAGPRSPHAGDVVSASAGSGVAPVGPHPRGRALRADFPFRHVALVLSGGGALGAYEVGVLKVLERLGLAPALVAGVSSGALNAVAWVAH